MERLSKVTLVLNGKVVTQPELVSRHKGTKILSVDIENKRLSGDVDTFSIHFSNTLGVVVEEGMYIEVTGDIRTLNAKDSDRVIYQYVSASSIKVLDEEPEEYKNEVELRDVEMISFDGVRKSYSDDTKTLATYRIRVRRRHSRNSYFRVTTWGKDAVFLGNIKNSVKLVHLKCRLQSFHSQKNGRLRFCLVSFYLEVPESEALAESGAEVETAETSAQSEVSVVTDETA